MALETYSPLAMDYCLGRSTCSNLKDTPFTACGTKQGHGNLEQRSTVDQFANGFRTLTAKYETPAAMCGYFSVANATLLAQKLACWRVDRDELKQLFTELENPNLVAAEAEHFMNFLQEDRRAYVESHPSDFGSHSDIASYISAWVANYEISDYCLAQAKHGRLAQSIHFFRYNQMPEFETATHEERVRLEEERCFGTAPPGSAVCKKTAELEPGATRFFMERFLPDRSLLRPECWAQQCIKEDAAPPVFIVDVNDHFVVAVPLIIEPSSESQGGPTLLVVNTTRANYLHSPALIYLFDLIFGESVGDHNGSIKEVEHPN